MKTKPGQSKSSNVKVVVRVRPQNSQEREGNYKNVVKVIDDYMLAFDPKEDADALRFGAVRPVKNRQRTILERRARDLRFAFDRVFDETVSNVEVFENTTKSVIDSVLEGFNCSVFAYGATSAGKTHTMLGNPQEPGVIFQTMMELYKKIHDRREEYTCDVAVSYLEVSLCLKGYFIAAGCDQIQNNKNCSDFGDFLHTKRTTFPTKMKIGIGQGGAK